MPTPPEPPNRFERRRQRNRAALLEAAIALFQRQGVRATKLEEICEQADVSARTFFNHFETREHLYRAIAEQRAAQLAALIVARADEPGDFGGKLSHMFAGIGAYLSERPAWREMVGEMLALGAEGAGDANRTIDAAIRHFVAAGVAAGEVDDRHGVDVLADLLRGGLTVTLSRWCASDEGDLEDGLARMSGALLELFTARSRES